MKKFVLISVMMLFFIAGQSYAMEYSKAANISKEKKIQVEKRHHSRVANLFSKVKTKVTTVKKQIKDNIDNILGGMSSQLRTSVILMVIGLIFLILASAIGGSIIWAVGAIFFVLGALLLLLSLL